MNEDARFRDCRECELGSWIEDLGVLRRAVMAVEKGLERAFLIRAAIIGSSGLSDSQNCKDEE